MGQSRSGLYQTVLVIVLGICVVNSFSVKSSTWRSGISTNPDAVAAVRELCNSAPCRLADVSNGETGLAFLFASQRCTESFDDIVQTAHEMLGSNTILLSCVGGGVVGGAEESDDPTAPAVSLLSGILPSTAGVELIMFGPDEAPPDSSSKAWKAIARGEEVPSYIIFADPWSPIQSVLDGLDASGMNGAVVAGGVTCPTFGDEGPTVGINGRAYPRGTVVGVGLSGSVGVQAVVAQGCRPVGPAFAITDAEDNLINELDGQPATNVLRDFSGGALLSEEEKALVEENGLLCGLSAPGSSSVEDGDYLIRQILGYRLPSIILGATNVERGDVMRFHVRDSTAAQVDLHNMIARAKTERMFAGSGCAGVPFAALQVSCVARGRSLFKTPNVDLSALTDLVGAGNNEDGISEPAVGGFFANGEIGPVGIGGVGLGPKQTHMHGFTTVAAMLCDFSDTRGDSEGEGGGESKIEGDGYDAAAWG